MTDSPTPNQWNPEFPTALVVACPDGRFQAAQRAFVEHHLRLEHVDYLSLPGGGGALSASGVEFSRAGQHAREAQFLIRAHRLEQVVLLFHGPAQGGPDAAACGDYLRKFPGETVARLRERQDADAIELVRRGFGPGIPVRAYRCEVTADLGYRFVRLASEEAEVFPVEVADWNRPDAHGVHAPTPDETETELMVTAREAATLGGGCFWCLEAVFTRLAGVERVVSGYAGGAIPNPSYELVCTGTTGHAEVVQVTFDPATISYLEVLEVFFSMHDPTTLNRQGPDIGTQYRSIVLAHSPEQRETAEALIVELDAAGIWKHAIVTEVADLEAFYPAEGHHQDYYRRNPAQPYCQAMIDPKVAKLREQWAAKLKPA